MQKKILFINSTESDYMQDIAYAGLKALLGDDLIDYPLNLNYRYSNHVYPRNLGLIKSHRLSFDFKNRLLFMMNHNTLKDLGAVIVAAAKADCFRTYERLIPMLATNVPVVFIDGGDRPEIGGDLDRLGAFHLYKEVTKSRPFDLIFKREYLLDAKYENNVFPMPFGVNSEFFENYNQVEHVMKYDVSFWAVESDPIRSRALELLQAQFDCQNNGTHRNQVFKKYKRKGLFYLRELKACKIVLNFRGVGWDTLRYWEVPALSTFMISGRPKILIPNNFIEGSEVIFCKDDLSDLLELCRHYLQDHQQRIKIANNAYNKIMSFHTHLHRGKEILGKIHKLAPLRVDGKAWE